MSCFDSRQNIGCFTGVHPGCSAYSLDAGFRCTSSPESAMLLWMRLGLLDMPPRLHAFDTENFPCRSCSCFAASFGRPGCISVFSKSTLSCGFRLRWSLIIAAAFSKSLARLSPNPLGTIFPLALLQGAHSGVEMMSVYTSLSRVLTFIRSLGCRCVTLPSEWHLAMACAFSSISIASYSSML